jgi:monofunctional biosynthetic peptidoglycan transglycosylase
MEVYLNIAEWGPGIYGAEAAARHHFKKPAAKLTRREASLLAASLPNPLARNPAKPGRGLTRYANRIAARIPSTQSVLGCLGV